MSISQSTLRVQAELAVPGGPGRWTEPVALSEISSRTRSAATPSGRLGSVGLFPSLVTSWGSVSPSVVQVAGVWLFQETAQRLQQAVRSAAPTTRARMAVMNGLQPPPSGCPAQFTQHAFLVAWGEFAHEIGLIQKLRQVTIPQKDVIHLSQAKVLTFLLGTLAGIAHLRDLNDGPHPLAHDGPALRAWGLATIAHYTGVSRTLACCDEKTVATITQVLDDVSQPFLDREVALLLARKLPLILDLDLAPRPVSNTSTTFPDAQFGWQDDRVGQGYDAALVSLTSLTYGRLLLTGFHYPRNPIALPRLQAMLMAAEARLGRRPRRRPELIKHRLQALTAPLAQRQDWLQAQLNRQKECLAQRDALLAEVARLETEVTALEADYQTRGQEVKPHSQLAQAQHRLAAVHRKLAHLPELLRRAEQAAAAHRQRLDQLQAEYTALEAHQAQLEADNAANPEPVIMVARLDAGFGTDPNVTWLIEMGYLVYTKAFNAQVATRLKDQVAPDARWTGVGGNAEMLVWGEGSIGDCPYPLTLALERFHTPEGQKHSALIAYRDDGQALTLPAWFDFYNGRQIIEAGIKESNVVFHMHPLKMRSRGGIALQEQFALFAANFVRWAAAWLQDKIVFSTPRFDECLTRVKAMVRVAANTSAWLVEDETGLLVKFDDTGAYPGAQLRLAAVWRTQPLLLPHRKVQKFDFRDAFVSGCT